MKNLLGGFNIMEKAMSMALSLEDLDASKIKNRPDDDCPTSIDDRELKKYLEDLGIVTQKEPNESLLADIQKAIKGKKLDLSNEKRLQGQLEEAFSNANIDFIREYKLSQKDIIDFYIVSCSIGLEIKIQSKANAMSIYRQLERYATSDEIKTLLLITNKAISLPDSINNKPIYILRLGRTQL